MAIRAAELGPGRSAVTVVLFAAGAASPSALPVLLRLVLGERIVAPLGATRHWLVTHNDAVVAVVKIVIGVMVASKVWTSL